MTSAAIATLGVTFSAALVLGMWAEEAHKQSPQALRGAAWWVPAALGVLRAEVFIVQGLLILLVAQPSSWPPFAVLVLAGAVAGVTKFVLAAGPELSWWPTPFVEGALLVSWAVVVAVFMSVPYPFSVRIELMVLLVFAACCIFGMARLAAEALPGTSVGDGQSTPSEYVAVAETSSRA